MIGGIVTAEFAGHICSFVMGGLLALLVISLIIHSWRDAAESKRNAANYAAQQKRDNACRLMWNNNGFSHNWVISYPIGSGNDIQRYCRNCKQRQRYIWNKSSWESPDTGHWQTFTNFGDVIDLQRCADARSEAGITYLAERTPDIEGCEIGVVTHGEAVCAVCRETLADQTIECPYCKTMYHQDCWSECGCGTYGCPNSLAMQSRTMSESRYNNRELDG